MKPDKAELKAALQDKASNYGGGNSIADYEVFKHAAEYLLSIMDDLDEMIEARAKADTQGYWFQVDADLLNDGLFSVTAANAIARIAKEK